MTAAVTTAERKIRCRYLVTDKRGSTDRCQSEVAELGAEIELCVKHLGDALALLRRRLNTN